MKWRQLGAAPDGARSYVVVADAGDEASRILSDFADEQALSAAQITAVGAFRRATVGWFNPETKNYRRIDIDQQCEVLSLLGDVAAGTEGSEVHAHVVLGLPDGSVRGGHLLGAEVWPTLEVMVRESPAELAKTYRPEIGLALIDLGR